MAARPRLHALLLPMPLQGHISPMLSVASSLASLGSSITFVLTHQSYHSILNASPTSLTPSHTLDIRFVTIPDGLPASFKLQPTSPESFFMLLDGIQQQQGLLEEIVESSRTGNNPISCIISGLFFPWVQDLANKVALPRAVFWTSSAVALQFCYLTKSRQATREALERDELDLGNVQVEKHIILSTFFRPENGLSYRMEEASHILVNSFQALEGSLQIAQAQAVASKMSFVGPCLPGDLLESNPTEINVRGSFFREDVECLQWLDMQAAASVLFISFGSIGFVPPAQIQQIALGIEASSIKFLWVLRPDTQAKEQLPEGFLERTTEQGQIISWAPQLRVLGHPATGGFMTHCGWNSMLESMFMGVPMLCMPIFAEQPVNRDLAVKQWRVGLAFEGQNEDGVVGKEEVERMARMLMQGDDVIRENSKRMKDEARQAMKGGGSSYTALSKFMHEMGSLTTPR